MSTWKKVAIGAAVLIVVVIFISVTVYQSKKNLVTVQTAKAQTKDLATVVSA